MEKELSATLSPANHLDRSDWMKWLKNVLMFAAPTMVIFFQLLANGVPVDKAYPVAVLALYQSLADLFKKYKSDTITLNK